MKGREDSVGYASEKAARISLGGRTKNRPIGSVVLYRYEREAVIFGEQSRRSAGTWTCYNWATSDEQLPEGADIIDRWLYVS